MRDRLRTPLRLACLFPFLVWVLSCGVLYALAEEAASAGPSTHTAALPPEDRQAFVYAIAATMSFACLAAGFAVAKVGSAALGAAAEKPELLGRALLYVGLAEGIAIYGLIVAVLLYMKL